MTLKLEENELLAALLTAQILGNACHNAFGEHVEMKQIALPFRTLYLEALREFVELNKAEMAGVRDEQVEALFRREGGESRMEPTGDSPRRDGETK